MARLVLCMVNLVVQMNQASVLRALLFFEVCHQADVFMIAVGQTLKYTVLLVTVRILLYGTFYSQW